MVLFPENLCGLTCSSVLEGVGLLLGSTLLTDQDVGVLYEKPCSVRRPRDLRPDRSVPPTDENLSFVRRRSWVRGGREHSRVTPGSCLCPFEYVPNHSVSRRGSGVSLMDPCWMKLPSLRLSRRRNPNSDLVVLFYFFLFLYGTL